MRRSIWSHYQPETCAAHLPRGTAEVASTQDMVAELNQTQLLCIYFSLPVNGMHAPTCHCNVKTSKIAYVLVQVGFSCPFVMTRALIYFQGQNVGTAIKISERSKQHFHVLETLA